jgi:hypothetical protein
LRRLALSLLALCAPLTAAASGSLPRLQLTPVTLAVEGQAPGNDLGFDLLGEEKPKPPSADQLQLEHRLRTRRRMLTLHQGVGLGTLALLAGTVVVGQLNYSDKFGGNAPSARYETPHELLALATLVGFTATGVLGLLAPVPDEKPHHFDTVAAHKLAMAGATLGMLAEAGLGLYTQTHEGLSGQRSLAQAHQVIGYSTLGLMGIGAGALLFE